MSSLAFRTRRYGIEYEHEHEHDEIRYEARAIV